MRRLYPCFAVAIFMLFGHAHGADISEEALPQRAFRELDKEVQSLKQEVLELNRDLFLLEEDLLFPSSTQLSIFVSLDVGPFFRLDAVQIQLDGQVVANYLYTAQQIEAMQHGGVHRIYTGNLRDGKHELVSSFIGKGPNDREYRRETALVIDKGAKEKYIELKVVDKERKHQPGFEIKEW